MRWRGRFLHVLATSEVVDVLIVVPSVIGLLRLVLVVVEDRQHAIEPRIGRRYRIHRYHTLYLIGIAARVQLDQGASRRIPSEHVRARHVSLLEQLVKIGGDLGGGSRRGCRTAGSDVCSVVDASHGLPSKGLLHLRHVVSRRGFSRWEDRSCPSAPSSVSPRVPRRTSRSPPQRPQ